MSASPEPAVVPVPSSRIRWRRRAIVAGLFGFAAIAGVVGLLVAFDIAQPRDLALLLERARVVAADLLGRLPPGALLAATAVLPAFGFPVSPLYLLVGTLGPALALPGLAVSVAINVTLSWWLARGALRPVLVRLLARRGRSIPVAPPERHTALIVAVRLTPGLPLFLQSTILALAGPAFRRYLALSWLLQYPIAVAMALLGESALRGRLGVGLAAVGILVLAWVAFSLLRRRVARVT